MMHASTYSRSVPTSHTHQQAIRRLHAAIRLYRNPDSASERSASFAAFEGRAAYWCASGYSATTRWHNVDALNEGIDLRVITEDRLHFNETDQAFLDSLVPLNREAANDMVEAYARIGERVTTDDIDTRHALRLAIA